MKVIWKGETLDVPEEYGKRLVGQGAEIVTSSVTADAEKPHPSAAPTPSPEGKAVSSAAAAPTPSAKGKAKKESV